MPARSNRLDKIDILLKKMEEQEHHRHAMELGIELSNELMFHLGLPEEQSRSVDYILEDAFANSEFKNQKMETWFRKHPILGNARIALHHVQDSNLPFESYFYMFADETSKAKIAATANLFTHWEDSDLTKFPTYKVGIHFFVSHDGKVFYFVITNSTNIRVLELQERLSNTQSEILDGLKGVLDFADSDESEPQQSIHTQLWKAFELNQVNKRFYEGIAESFKVLVQHLNNNKYEKKEAQLFSSRLLGRLIFIWFLRKKNIIHESMGYFDPVELSDINYYQQKLKVLFFDTLNTPIEDRRHTDVVTPYLNGGLFEAHENDWTNQIIPFPKNWFEDLYDHFNRFNFTTDESTPEYEQVAIDPEMLGRVFENLLASVVPETSNAANDRKNKGAFYTPREIVSFMTKESLKQFLKTKIDNEKFHFGIDQLIDLNDAKFLEQKSTGNLQLWGSSTKEIQSKVIEALNSIKVLDPACGSGAFPIGMLQLLSQTYERIQAFYVQEEKAHRLAHGNERFNSYQTKLHIIQASLFGSDIEPMAIEIARLRTWLSLVIEDMSKVEPLPNLDFNFVCANSLIPLVTDEQISIFDDTEYEERLAELREEFFSTHDIDSKLDLKQRFADLYDEKLHSIENSKRINQLKSWNPFNANQPADFFDAKVMFNTEGFDVVIGNPPYIGEKGNKSLFEVVKTSSLGKRFYMGKMDYFYFFYHLGLDLIKNNGCLTYISTNYFITADGATNLRKDIFYRSNVVKIVNFGDMKIFDSARGQHNLIVILQKFKGVSNNETILISNNESINIKSDELSEFLKGNSKLTRNEIISKEELFYDILSDNFYIRLPESNPIIQSIIMKIAESTLKLKDVANINQGVITGGDVVTTKHLKKYSSIKANKGDGIFVYRKGLLNELGSETGIIKPYFKTTDIYKWYTNHKNTKEILYLNGNVKPSDEILSYLLQFELLLRSRREFVSGDRPWYSLWWPRSEDIFVNEKIVVSSISKSNNFGFNNIPWFASGGSQGGIFYITKKKNEPFNPYFLLGILNSKLMYFWLYNRGKRKGEYLALSGTPLGQIPIPICDDILAQNISENVLRIIDNISEDKPIELQEKINNKLIYSLYNINESEIDVIENFYSAKH